MRLLEHSHFIIAHRNLILPLYFYCYSSLEYRQERSFYDVDDNSFLFLFFVGPLEKNLSQVYFFPFFSSSSSSLWNSNIIIMNNDGNHYEYKPTTIRYCVHRLFMLIAPTWRKKSEIFSLWACRRMKNRQENKNLGLFPLSKSNIYMRQYWKWSDGQSSCECVYKKTPRSFVRLNVCTMIDHWVYIGNG